MAEVYADFNKQGQLRIQPASVVTNAVTLRPFSTTQTAMLLGLANQDESASPPTNYTYGGIGAMGPVFATKTTSGAPADTDFSGNSPVIPTPPVASAIYNTNTHKLYVRDAAASWLSTVAFT